MIRIHKKSVQVKKIALLSTSMLLAGGASATTVKNVQIILDVSGSMFDKLPEGQTRIDAAKSVLSSFVDNLQEDSNLNVGLRLYGTGMYGKSKCMDSKLVLPMRGVNKANLQSEIQKTKPKGATPIVYSLLQAAKDFPADNSQKTIVLVTDGEESCGGRLNDVKDIFAKRGINVDVRIIGIDLSEKARKSFVGFGKLENIKSAEEFSKALGRATNSVPITSSNGQYGLKFITPVKEGSPIKITWSGPNNKGDYVTVVPKDSPDGRYWKYFYTKNGKTGTLAAPTKAGEYEVRYATESGRPKKTLYSQPLQVVKEQYSLNSPETIKEGAPIKITWSGPNNKGDYVTIVPKDSPDGRYWEYFYTKDGKTGTLAAPTKAGEYEVRYATEAGRPKKTLYSQPLQVVKEQYSLNSPETIKEGAPIKITWSGPNNKGDYVTIVPKDSPDGRYWEYFYTKDGKTGTLAAPTKAGEYEVRYATEAGRPKKTLYSVNIQVKQEQYSLDVPKVVNKGQPVKITWDGPNNKGDYITIVPKDSPDGRYGKYFYTKDGKTGTLAAPTKAGEYEVRYATESGRPKKTLYKVDIVVR